MGLCRPFPQQTFGAQVIRAHDVRQFAFSVNWVRRADLPHILSYGFWASAHPFLSHYLTTGPSQFCSCGVPSVHGLSGPAGLPLLRVSSSQFSVVECGVFVGCQCSHICVLPCTLCPLFCCCLYILYVIASLCICNCLCLCTFFSLF